VKAICTAHGVKQRTLYRWLSAYRIHGLAGLTRCDRGDKGKPRIVNGAAHEFLWRAALPERGAYGELTRREIFRAYEEERQYRLSIAGKRLSDFDRHKYRRYLDDKSECLTAAAQLPRVTYETLRIWFNQIPECVITMGRKGEEAFSDTELLSFRNLAALMPLQYVVMDHRQLDVFCLVHIRGGFKLVRPWVTAALDMRTRKWLSWAIVETPSSDSIATTLKRTFLEYGLPTAVYWDNGRDYRSVWLEGGAEKSRKASAVGDLDGPWRGVLDTLGIRVHHAIVRRARSKLIEPSFVRLANFDRTLPYYCGNKPGARPAHFRDLLSQHEKWLRGEISKPAFPTIEEIAKLYTEDAFPTLNERELQGDGMRVVTPTGHGWACPNQVWENLIPHVARRTVSEQVLHFVFAKRREIKVRNAEVCTAFGGQPFHYRMIGNSTALMALNGRTVELAYDPLDLETVALYVDGQFLGLANNVELRRMGEAGFVQDERDRRHVRREVKGFIRKIHEAVPFADYRERADRRRAVAPRRVEPARPVVEVPIAAPIAKAAAAAEEDKKFSFADAPTGAALIAAADRSAYLDDDEFQFFSDESSEKGKSS